MATHTQAMRLNKRVFSGVRPPSVADLARCKAAAVSEQAFPLLPSWLLKLDAPFAGLIARQCVETTHKLASLHIWFKGASAAVDDMPVGSFIDKAQTLVPAMEDMEAKLLRLRADILNVATTLKKVDIRRAEMIGDSLRLYAQANADLFESVQAYKWAVLEHDYRADMVAGLIAESFVVVEDLIARLKS